MDTIFIDDSMDHNDLDADQMVLLSDLIDNYLKDYIRFLEVTEPQATNTIRRLVEASRSVYLGDDEAEKFVEFLKTQ